jgi:type VI protein secretion system component Hcp
MAGEIDAFLYFGPSIDGRKPKQINGETGDESESQSDAGGYGASMAIQQYSIGFTHQMDHTEEMKHESDESQMHEPEIGSVTITKLVDAASPYLLGALWKGTQYTDAWISQRKAGGAKGKSGDYFWQIELIEVSIESITWSADAGGQTTEQLTLKANKGVYVQYFKQLHTGKLVEKADDCKAEVKRVKGKKNGASDLNPSQIDGIVKEVMKRLGRPQSAVAPRSGHGHN